MGNDENLGPSVVKDGQAGGYVGCRLKECRVGS